MRGRFDESRHRRGRGGQWVDMPDLGGAQSPGASPLGLGGEVKLMDRRQRREVEARKLAMAERRRDQRAARLRRIAALREPPREKAKAEGAQSKRKRDDFYDDVEVVPDMQTYLHSRYPVLGSEPMVKLRALRRSLLRAETRSERTRLLRQIDEQRANLAAA